MTPDKDILTWHLKIDGWKTILFLRPIFRGCVSCREGTILPPKNPDASYGNTKDPPNDTPKRQLDSPADIPKFRVYQIFENYTLPETNSKLAPENQWFQDMKDF